MARNIRQWYGGGTYGTLGRTSGNVEASAQATNSASSLRGRTAGTAKTTATGESNPDQVSRAAQVGAQGNPLLAFFITFGIFIAVWWGVHKLDGDDGGQRRIIPFTAANFFVNGVGALLFIYLAKITFTKWPFPGVTTVVHGV
jgi:hypothetical protein